MYCLQPLMAGCSRSVRSENIRDHPVGIMMMDPDQIETKGRDTFCLGPDICRMGREQRIGLQVRAPEACRRPIRKDQLGSLRVHPAPQTCGLFVQKTQIRNGRVREHALSWPGLSPIFSSPRTGNRKTAHYCAKKCSEMAHAIPFRSIKTKFGPEQDTSTMFGLRRQIGWPLTEGDTILHSDQLSWVLGAARMITSSNLLLHLDMVPRRGSRGALAKSMWQPIYSQRFQSKNCEITAAVWCSLLYPITLPYRTLQNEAVARPSRFTAGVPTFFATKPTAILTLIAE